jgi:hypothetical protein
MKAPPQDEVRRYLILSALRDNPGPMLMSEVYVKVRLLREKMNRPFTERELKPVGHMKKEPAWNIEIRQDMRRMITERLAKRMRSPFGCEITRSGLEWLESQAAIATRLPSAIDGELGQ